MNKIKRLLDYLFDRRISRGSYTLGIIGIFVIILIPPIVFTVIPRDILNVFEFLADTLYGLWFLIALLAAIFSWSLHIRRLHDLGWSGLWALLIPVLSLLMIIFLMIVPGDRGLNKYGPAPK